MDEEEELLYMQAMEDQEPAEPMHPAPKVSVTVPKVPVPEPDEAVRRGAQEIQSQPGIWSLCSSYPSDQRKIHCWKCWQALTIEGFEAAAFTEFGASAGKCPLNICRGIWCHFAQGDLVWVQDLCGWWILWHWWQPAFVSTKLLQEGYSISEMVCGGHQDQTIC